MHPLPLSREILQEIESAENVGFLPAANANACAHAGQCVTCDPEETRVIT